VTFLLAVPNVSEGRDSAILDAIGAAFVANGARLLDRHEDPDHHRAVFSLTGAPGQLSAAVVAGAAEVIARIDLRDPRGQHPHIGAIDVAPIVYPTPADRGAACAEAVVTADRLGRELELPVFLYGILAGGRTRAELRRGGIAGLAQRLEEGELRPDYGPKHLHPSAGAVLVSARPPLVAFNVELAAPADLATARAIAAKIREGGTEGLAGLRAIGIELHTRERTAQVSMNVEAPDEVSLAEIVAAISAHADVAGAEIVALVPRVALDGFPEDVALRGFDPARQIIENHLDW
jgi:glutamate formiminotransferase